MSTTQKSNQSKCCHFLMSWNRVSHFLLKHRNITQRPWTNKRTYLLDLIYRRAREHERILIASWQRRAGFPEVPKKLRRFTNKQRLGAPSHTPGRAPPQKVVNACSSATAQVALSGLQLRCSMPISTVPTRRCSPRSARHRQPGKGDISMNFHKRECDAATILWLFCLGSSHRSSTPPPSCLSFTVRRSATQSPHSFLAVVSILKSHHEGPNARCQDTDERAAVGPDAH